MENESLQTKKLWWTIPQSSILTMFSSDATNGLSSETVEKSRDTFGANTIDEVKPTGALELILDGVREPMMIVLLSIGALSFVFGKAGEAVVMVFVVAAYIAVEFVNKYRTDRTMTRLRQLTSPTTKVIRDGKPQEIPCFRRCTAHRIIWPLGERSVAHGRIPPRGKERGRNSSRRRATCRTHKFYIFGNGGDERRRESDYLRRRPRE